MYSNQYFVSRRKHNYVEPLQKRTSQVVVEDPRVTVIKTRLIALAVIILAILVVANFQQIVDGFSMILRGGVEPFSFVKNSLNSAHNWEVFNGVLH